MPTPEDNLKAPAQTAQKAAGAVKNAKQIIQTAKLVGAAGTGPVGWAVALAPYLAKFKDQIRKAIAAAVGLGAYLLYMLWLKLLGMLAGLAFGAITGLPLLLIPGAGPFLYAGWTGFWTMRGIADPTGTINLATHPWEAITKPLSWVQGQFSGVGGGIESAGSAVAQGTSTAASATGGFVTGAGSALWNGLTTAAGNSLGWLSAGLGKGLGLLSTAGTTVAGMASTAVGWAVGLTVTTAYAASIIVPNSAHFSPEGDIFGPQTGQNELFTITKTAQPPSIDNPDVLGKIPITFTVKITAAASNIVPISITDQTTSSNGSVLELGSDTCQQAQLPPIINAGGQWTCTLVVNANHSQSNSTITNTATFTATGNNGTPTTDVASATVRVGSPPQSCENFDFVSGTGASGSSWSQAEIDTINSICNTLLAQSPTIMTLINNAGTITLVRYSGGCSGFVSGGTIANFYGCNLSSFDSAKYVFIHELGHVIGNVNNSVYTAYEGSGAYENEGNIKTYPICPGSKNENFAETIADYMIAKTYNFPARCTGYPGGPYTTFQSDYPAHYNFAKFNIFGGVEF